MIGRRFPIPHWLWPFWLTIKVLGWSRRRCPSSNVGVQDALLHSRLPTRPCGESCVGRGTRLILKLSSTILVDMLLGGAHPPTPQPALTLFGFAHYFNGGRVGTATNKTATHHDVARHPQGYMVGRRSVGGESSRRFRWRNVPKMRSRVSIIHPRRQAHRRTRRTRTTRKARTRTHTQSAPPTRALLHDPCTISLPPHPSVRVTYHVGLCVAQLEVDTLLCRWQSGRSHGTLSAARPSAWPAWQHITNPMRTEFSVVCTMAASRKARAHTLHGR